MPKGEWNNRSKNTIPLQLPITYLKPVKRNTITHEFGSGSHAEIPPPQENDDNLSEASKLLRQGIQQQQAGELIAALKSLQQSLGLFQAVGDLQKQAQALSFLALVTYSAGDYKGAISYSQQCLSLLNNTSDLAVQMQALSHLGNAYRHLNDHKKQLSF